MSKIKGRYVATVVIDIDYEETDKTNPVEQIRENVCGGALTDAIREVIDEWIVDESIGTLRVTQDYAEIHLAEEDVK